MLSLYSDCAVILVNWRQAQRTVDAVGVLKELHYGVLIIIVDNGSDDDSASRLKSIVSNDVVLLTSDHNVGFGAGNNIGIVHAISLEYRYIWLLNNDATPEAHCLSELMSAIQDRDDIGAVGALAIDPTSMHPPHSGSIMNSFSLNSTYTDDDRIIEANSYSWVSAACMLIKTDVIRQIGLFDEHFFMYWEDADLCQRIKKQGYKLGVSHNALVYHQAGTSSKGFETKRHQWHLESQRRYLVKHHWFSPYAIIVLYMRHIMKSIVSGNIPRLIMTLKSIT